MELPTVWVADPFPARARSRSGEPPPRWLRRSGGAALAPCRGRGGLRSLLADLNLVRDGFERFDLLDDRVRFLQGDLRRDAGPSPDRAGRAAAHRRQRPRARRRVLERLYDKVAVGGFVVVDGYVDPAVPRRSRRSATKPAIADQLGAGRSTGGAPLAQAGRGRLRAAGARGRRPSTCREDLARDRPEDVAGSASPAPSRPWAPPEGPVGRRRLLQHAARGRAHAALAQPRLPAGHRGPRLRGHRRRERLRRRPAPRRGVRRQASGPSSATSTWARTPTRRRSLALNRGHRRGQRRAPRPHDRRRPRAHARRAALRHARACAPTSPPIVATQQWYVGPGQQGDADGRRLRPGMRGPPLRADRLAGRRLPPVRDRPLHRRARLVRRRLGEQLPVRAPRAARAGRRLRRELRHARRRLRQPRPLRAPRRRRPASPWPRSSARARSTRSTAAPPPTRPTPTSADRRIGGYGEHYAELRGRAFRGPGKPIHYVGTITRRAAPPDPVPPPDGAGVLARQAIDGPRRRARRAPSRARGAAPRPSPRPSGTAWRGSEHHLARPAGARRAHRPARLPGAHRPGAARLGRRAPTGDGGRHALFLASICDLLGHGQVLVGRRPMSGRSHPRARAHRRPARRRRHPAKRSPTTGRRRLGLRDPRWPQAPRPHDRRVQGLRAARARRVLRRGRAVGGQRRAGLARLRARSPGGDPPDQAATTRTSCPTSRSSGTG